MGQQSSSAQGAIVVECLLAALLCARLVHLFAAPVTTLDVKLTVFLAWWLGMAGVLLLPLDLSFAYTRAEEQFSSLAPLWQFIYWGTFVLAWVVLPLQHDYHRSGYFLPLDKMRDAIRRNLLFYSSIGALGLVYIVIASLKKNSTIGVGFLMALGNTYGILLLCFFMGNGLVGLPVRLWQMSDDEGELQRLYLAAPAVEASYQEARFELEDCVAEVQECGRFIYTHAAPSRTQLLGNVDVLLAVVGAVSPSLITTRTTATTTTTATSSSLQQLLSAVEDKTGTEEESLAKYNTTLVQLHARLKRSHMLALVTSRKWRLLCSRAQRLGGGGGGEQQRIRSGVAAAGALKTLSVCSALLSVIVIWCELVMASSLSSPIELVLVSLASYNNPVWVQTVSFLTLAYVSTCAYWSLFRGNLFGLEYVVSSPQLSPPAALIVNGEYFTRLQFSVGFNFLLLLNSKQRLTSDSVAFLGLLQNMQTIPLLGTSFTVYAPICLVVVSLLTLCNGYGKLLSFLGVDIEDSNTSISSCIYGAADLTDEDSLSTGKRMVRAEWRAQELSAAAAAAASAASATTAVAPGVGKADTVVISPLPSSSSLAPSVSNNHHRNIKLELPNVRRLDVKVRGGGYLGVVDESEGRGSSGSRGRVESWGLGEEDDDEEGGGGGGGRYRD
jgi:hypothetical protein